MRGTGVILIIGLFVLMLAAVGPLRGPDGRLLRPNVTSLAEVKANYLFELQKAKSSRNGLQAALQENLDLLPVSKTTGPVSFSQIIGFLGFGQLNSLAGLMLPLAILSVVLRAALLAIPKKG